MYDSSTRHLQIAGLRRQFCGGSVLLR